MDNVQERERVVQRDIYPEVAGAILSSIGILLLCTSLENMIKQTACVLIGIIGYEILSPMLRKRGLTSFICVMAALVGLALLAANFLVGDSSNGAQNWLTIKGWRFQPAELVKVCVAVQAASLRKDTSINRYVVFTAFSAISVIVMALINDFGSALIFFIGYLTASVEHRKYLISGMAVTAAAGAGFLAVKFKPHIAARFASCGKAWANPDTTGYQQTRTMIALASGGLLGVGLGKGWLRNVTAASTDMVFGVVCEELGLVIGVIIVALVMAVGIKALLRRSGCGAVTAAVMMMVQMSLNVLGSLDIIPFTGVTFPFVSQGGTSIIACWGLLAIISGDRHGEVIKL